MVAYWPNANSERHAHRERDFALRSSALGATARLHTKNNIIEDRAAEKNGHPTIATKLLPLNLRAVENALDVLLRTPS